MEIGFAIPSSLAASIARQLIQDGEVTRGYLGVVIQPLTPELAESFETSPGEGILVAEVSAGSPAEKAGLHQGDVIVAFEDVPVTDVGRFRNQVALTPPGTRVVVTIMREGRRLDLEVTIGKLSEERPVAESGSTEAVGLTVQTLTPKLAEQFDARPGEGVLVTEVEPGSVAAMAGIEPGAIILQVNRRPVKSASEFRQAVGQSRDSRRMLLLIRQNGMQRYVALSW